MAFTNDGFGILRLISDGSTGMEWRYIDSANDDKITLSGYDWAEYDFERLYVNYDGTRIYASMYPNLFSPLVWLNRQHRQLLRPQPPKLVKTPLKDKAPIRQSNRNSSRVV